MTPLCILLALGPALVWGVLVWKLASAHGRLGSLRDVDIEQPPQTGWPRLSVVVPARNEATDIEEALRSLLAQDYPDLEVIAVDDRSEDGTGVILDRLATEHASLRVLHIAELPDGWLGKTHACHAGARLATGSFLLFTDADVRFAPDALRRAIAFATSKRLGHLVAWPQLIAPGFWERCFQATFAMFLNFKLRPWELHVPGSRGFVGMGAFNLVSRDSYAKVGGHEILAMEVVDDVKLGLVLRRSGIRQGSIAAGDLVRVPWARGLSGSAPRSAQERLRRARVALGRCDRRTAGARRPHARAVVDGSRVRHHLAPDCWSRGGNHADPAALGHGPCFTSRATASRGSHFP